MNNVIKLYFLILILVSSCKSNRPGYIRVIPEEKKAEAASWILDCIEKGNPKSDEEPEDASLMCSSLAHGLFGDCVYVEDARSVMHMGGNWCSVVVDKVR